MYHHRSQTDENFALVSLETGISFDPEEDRTRQEFADDADVNKLLNKYGALPPMNTVRFGEHDFDVDLLTAYSAISQAESAYSQLPESVRKAFPDWHSLAEALSKGDIASAIAEANKSPSGAAEPVSGSADALVPPAGDTK